MGSHQLEIEEGRFRGMPRSKRVCVREDERHFVFECERYAAIRRKYSDMFECEIKCDRDVNRWMNPVGEEAARVFWPRFNSFLRECLDVRNSARAELNLTEG